MPEVEDDEGEDDYYVTYTFVSRPGRAEEREVTNRDRVPREVFERLEEGGRVEIIYAPGEPEVARVTADYVPGAVDYVPAIVGAAVALPSLWRYDARTDPHAVREREVRAGRARAERAEA